MMPTTSTTTTATDLNDTIESTVTASLPDDNNNIISNNVTNDTTIGSTDSTNHPEPPSKSKSTLVDDTTNSKDTSHPHSSSSNTNRNSSIRMMNRLLCQEIYKEYGYMILGMSSMMISSYTNQILPQAIGRFIDRSTTSTDSATTTTSHQNTSTVLLTNIYVQLGMIVVMGGLASCLRTISLQIASQNITSRLKQYLYTSILLLSSSSSSTSKVPISAQSVLPDETPTTTTSQPTTTTTTTNSNNNPAASSLSPSYITSIMTNDVEQISQLITSQFVNTIRSLSATIFSLYHMITISPSLVLTTITIIPTLGVGTLIINKYMKKAIQQQHQTIQPSIQYVEERLAHLYLIQQYDRTVEEIIQYQQLEQSHQPYWYHAAILGGIRMGFMFGTASTTLLYVLHCGTTTTIRNRTTHNMERMTGGQLTTFTTYALLFGLGCTGLLKSHQERQQMNIGPLQRYANVLFLGRTSKRTNSTSVNSSTSSSSSSANPESCDDDSYIQTITQFIKPSPPAAIQQPLEKESSIPWNVDTVTSIEIQNVSFSYPPNALTSPMDTNIPITTTTLPDDNSATMNDERNWVLQNICMTIPKGKVVALVGHNGAGKSTLVNLLLGYYTPTTGNIQVMVESNKEDSNPVTTTVYPLRSQPTILPPRIQNQIVQVVTQTTSLFDMSIYDNVQYSNKYATESDVILALQDADGYDWAMQKPNGIHAMVGKNGNLLSGGEHQKIGLARALLNQPSFLILDEPTTHVDQNSNTKISKNILRRRRRQSPAPPSDGTNQVNNDSNRQDDDDYEKRGILLITHDVKMILEYQVDYVYVMKHGRIVEENTLDVLRSNLDSELCQLIPKLYLADDLRR